MNVLKAGTKSKINIKNEYFQGDLNVTYKSNVIPRFSRNQWPKMIFKNWA